MARKDELFRAVYANPDDDAPRSVLADFLQEAGDPRGELIALQLARARGGKKTRRESELLKPNLRKWLGPLLMAVPNRGLKYERGFVARCQLQHHRESIEPLLHHPEWATIVEVTPGRWKGSMQSLADACTGLRVLNTEENAGVLPSHPKLEKIVVRWVFENKDPEHLSTLKLPALRELVIENCQPALNAMKPFLTKAKALKRLSVSGVDDAEQWIPWLAKRGYERASVKSIMNPWEVGFEGDRVIADYIRGGHPEPQAGPQLAGYLRLVPSPKDWHVTIRPRYSWEGTTQTDAIRGCGAVLKKFASHVVEKSE